ncbi:MAG: DUF1264 domain-containing protein [Acidobacteriota bacterium]|nr:DUF1264 domain-containing protein [Acidobacteriota bacterium]
MRFPIRLTTPGSKLLGLTLIGLLAIYAVSAQQSGPASSAVAVKPTDGYNIHVLAPHVVKGKEMGPFHHYCKVISPDEPIIQCQIYNSTDANAPLTQIEYIIGKKVTRGGVLTLKQWNRDWHDHKQEIATKRVQVLDVGPEDQAKIAGIVMHTDGLIFDLWPHGSKIPTGASSVAQSVGHVKLKSLQDSSD